MSRIKIVFCSLSFVLFFMTGCLGEVESSAVEDKPLTVWYQHPAKDWMTEALPVGNGKIGAMVFGGVYQERLTLNEKSLWDGGPGEGSFYTGGNLKGGADKIESIRSLIKEKKYDEALIEGNKYFTGKGAGYGAYQVLGDLILDFWNLRGKAINYIRKLDLERGIHTVEYQLGSTKYQRDLFVSYPNNLIVMRLQSRGDQKLSFNLNLNSPQSQKNYRDMFGSALGHGIPPISRGRDIAIETVSDGKLGQLTLNGKLKGSGMEYQAVVNVLVKGGAVGADSIKGKNGLKSLVVENADSVLIFITAATDYLPKYPNYKGNDYQKQNKVVINLARQKSYRELESAHLSDYQKLFNQVSFKLDNGKQKNNNIPTDVRLKQFSKTEDLGLLELVYQYGRYLLISSSRLGALPANLQGMWNNSTVPPWSSDYHTNINLQMNYWPAEITGLSECHLPLLDYIATLVEPGKKTAQMYYGTRGWVVHTMNNPFGFTAPGWDVRWGHFPGGAGWLSQHLYQHYQFTGDKNYLKNKAWPVMKEAALFWVDYLTEGDNGKLVSAPSYSPEHGKFCAGSSMDHQIASELLSNCIEASKILKIEPKLREEFKSVLDRILEPQIGKWGQLQEWLEDWDDPNDHHRHVSHLYALYPGSAINDFDSPKLADAARVSLNARGDSGTGWSIAWKINFWARLRDGDRTEGLIKNLLRLTKQKDMVMNFGGGLYANLLDAHPPFQIDGNFGFVSGVTEMLLQSQSGKIEVLPALPNSWQNGDVKGLRARGGLICDIHWSGGKLSGLKLVSLNGGQYEIVYRKAIKKVSLRKGESLLIQDF